jgi:outer membrane receptor protein involved in Fe transport
MVYARVAKGYRPGGPNALPPAPPPNVPATFGADSLVNYEVGVKSQTADGRLQFDVAAFFIEWENIQLLTVVGGFGVNGNAGSAESKGIELSATWLPVDDLVVVIGGAWTDAKLTADTDPLLLGAVSGDRLPYIPELSTSLDVDYTLAPIGDFTPFVGGSWRYVGERDSGFDPANGQKELPSYHVIDLRAGVDRNTWRLQVYAKNLTDERGITNVGGGTSGVSGPAPDEPSPTISVIRPRVIGISLSGKI